MCFLAILQSLRMSPQLFFYDVPGLDLAGNDLYITEGTPVPFPAAFSLVPGEVIRFNLGPVTADGFLVTNFNVDFSSIPTDALIGIGHVSVPEPATLSLLALGGLILAKRRARRCR